MSTFRSFVREIHRRSLWRVLAIYAVGSWIAFQVILALVEGLGLPDWLPALAVVLFLVGLPIVLATALVQHDEALPDHRHDPTLLPGLETAFDAASHPQHPQHPQQRQQEHAQQDGQQSQQDQSQHLRMARRFFTWRNAIAGGVLAFAAWGLMAAWLHVRAGTGTAAGGQTADAAIHDGAVQVGAWGAGLPSGRLTVTGLPDDARVTLVPAGPDGELRDSLAWFTVTGASLRGGVDVPAAEYLLRASARGHNAAEFIAHVVAGADVALSRMLAPTAAGTDGMVLVAGSPLSPPFLMDRYEVTNADFQAFVAAGGYQSPAYWPEQMLVAGELLSFGRAMEAFVDRTGSPAPRGWSGGVHPPGEADHPVVGVSWYEARAYALWAGKELPTWEQWWYAALGGEAVSYPWGDDVMGVYARANFNQVATAPVGAHPLGVSPFGVHDMAGNVREWLLDARSDDGRRIAVGGSWLDASYMFEAAHAESFDPAFSKETIGFRCVRSVAPTP
jgi:hypothetical protein